MTDHSDMSEQVSFILSTGKRIRDYMFRVQGETIANDPALKLFAEMTMQQTSVAMMTMDRGAVSVTEMAGLLGVSVPSASTMIDRLVEKGVLAREPDSEDRRRVVITVAPEARRQLAKLQTSMQEALAELTSKIGADTTRRWYEVMRNVREVLDREERT